MLKILVKILAGLLVTCALAITAVITLVNLDHFKAAISDRVKQQTGRECRIEGKLHWTLTPWLALKAERITLGNAPGFSNDFLSVQTLEIEPKLMTLVTGKLFLQLHLDGVDLHLEKLSEGQNNWSDLVGAFAHASQTTQAVGDFEEQPSQNIPNSSNATEVQKKKPWFRVLMGGLSLNEMTIHWKNVPKSQHLQFTHMHIKADNLQKALLGKSIPLSLSLHLDNLQTQQSANVALNTALHIQPLEKTLQLDDFLLKLQLPSGNPVVLSGQIRVGKFDTQPELSGGLKLSTFKTQELASLFSNETIPAGLPKVISGKLNFEWKDAVWRLSEFTLHVDEGQLSLNGQWTCSGQTMNMATCLQGHGQGQIQGQHLRIQTLTLPSVSAEWTFQDNTLQMPYRLSLFEADHRGTILLSLKEQPHVTVNQMTDNFDMAACLKGLGVSSQLQGKGSLKTTFTSQGDSAEVLLKHVSGQGELVLNQGEWQGINLGYLLKHARASVKSLISSISVRSFADFGQYVREELGQWKQQSEQQKGITTVFESLTARFTLENQKIQPSDIHMVAHDYQVQGDGSIDFKTQTIAYRLKANVSSEEEHEKSVFKRFFAKTPLVISVTGALSNPSIKPELDVYLKSAAQFAKTQQPEEGNKPETNPEQASADNLSHNGKTRVKAMLKNLIQGEMPKL